MLLFRSVLFAAVFVITASSYFLFFYKPLELLDSRIEFEPLDIKKNSESSWRIPIEQLVDLKRKTLQSSSSSSHKDCFCPEGRKNWIHYSHCPGTLTRNHGAGIKDRQNILRNVMWFADELCAKIALDCTPKVWLSEKHGCFAPKKAQWDEYFTPVRKKMFQNGTQVLVGPKVDVLHWNYSQDDFKGLKLIRGKPSVEGYEIARKLYYEGRRNFVWDFSQTYWQTDLFRPKQPLNHRNYSDTCGVIDFETSEELLNIGHMALKELGIVYKDEYVTLHLRRGDYRRCITDPEVVMKYLKCSLGEDTVKNVIVLTNERDQDYIQNLTNMFSNAFPNKTMIMLDAFMESKPFLQSLSHHDYISSHAGDKFLKDNCFFFAAEKVVASMGKYHLERGHISCRRCDRGGSVKKNGGAMI